MDQPDTIPVTSLLSSGTLQSGPKYYLLENENPTKSVVLALVVHVGSLMESSEEQGLAHFIEHLGFKSTRGYEHYELVKFLEVCVTHSLTHTHNLTCSLNHLLTVYFLTYILIYSRTPSLTYSLTHLHSHWASATVRI